MKKLILVLIAMVTLSVAASAQKFGHITTDDIIQAMPETKAAQTALEAEGKKLEDQLQAMGVEYQNKVQAYQENVQLADAAPEKWSLALRADKEQEIMQLQERIQRFQENAQQSIQQKRTPGKSSDQFLRFFRVRSNTVSLPFLLPFAAPIYSYYIIHPDYQDLIV